MERNDEFVNGFLLLLLLIWYFLIIYSRNIKDMEISVSVILWKNKNKVMTVFQLEIDENNFFRRSCLYNFCMSGGNNWYSRFAQNIFYCSVERKIGVADYNNDRKNASIIYFLRLSLEHDIHRQHVLL